ncbi:MAG: hypothetical protein HYX69_16900 [Planctomycetia bacterium]|nr:hypothetical protein [Planctomycetia bacterium]
MTTAAIDWDLEASRAADYVAEFRRQEPHGAIAWEPAGTALVFLNDPDHGLRPAQKGVPLLRQHVEDAHIQTLAVASTEASDTWVLLAVSDHLGFLKGAAAAAWRAANEAEVLGHHETTLDRLLADVDIASATALEAPPPSAIFRRLL